MRFVETESGCTATSLPFLNSRGSCAVQFSRPCQGTCDCNPGNALAMNELDAMDDTWEEFFGTSTELMPSIMGAIDAIWEGSRVEAEDCDQCRPLGVPRRVLHNSFANLSPNVQKILSNVPNEALNINSADLVKKFDSAKRTYRPKDKPCHSSNESLDIISPNVQKMLSNLPDQELVKSNGSFLHKNAKDKGLRSSQSFCDSRTSLSQSQEIGVSCSVGDNLSAIDHGEKDGFSSKPLGSYLHKSTGIAARTPVGRKNLGKYLQVPSESTNSTVSSEVSRPVSLTSLGSCSSSSSGGHHQAGSAYLASAESLDSDPEPAGSQGSADSGIAEQTAMSPEQCVLQEVMDTETVYVADLREVIEGYLIPWRDDTECPLLPYLEHLFSNLEKIYLFNRSFLEDLNRSNCNPTSIANAFLHNDAGFSIYTEYCTHYPLTMTVLGELTADEKMAALFRERQLALRHALPLGSYLLKPVQRILKYHLLLQRLSKQCAQMHQSTVDLALTTMTSVASHINTMKRKHEHAVRVQEIQSLLYGWTGPDLTALGELIAEGTFRVGGARGRRHIFLFDRVLLICKSKQDGSLAYKSHVMCSNLMLVEQVRGEPLSFHILPFDNPRQQVTLRARSPQHKREWTLQIKRVILENYSAVIPSHARQLVMQLGQNVQEDESSDKWSPLKHHSTPQYLERRSRVQKSRDFGSRRAASQDRSFVSLGSWRRKSEPGFIDQYSSKTLAKKNAKAKKLKDVETAKFYTDFSDSENGDAFRESMDSIETKKSFVEEETSQCENIEESSLECEADTQLATSTLEKVVSDLLMQNEEFQKLMNRQRRYTRDAGESQIWNKQEDDLPSKADSLPRDFQLNDQIESKAVKEESAVRDDSSFKNKRADVEVEDLQESDLSSQLNNDNEHPDHRIYRKSAIRFSLVQRFRAIISEEQRKPGKVHVTYMQGSESMGAKIAHPDYADPKKLFRPSQSLSQVDLCVSSENLHQGEKQKDKAYVGSNCGKVHHRKTTDNNIQENQKTANDSQEVVSSQPSTPATCEAPKPFHASSHAADSYYERLMEKNLNDSSVGRFRSTESKTLNSRSVKRPTKAPPPVPVKPTRLLNIEVSKENINNIDSNFHTGRRKIFVSKALYEVTNEKEEVTEVQSVSTQGWVKTIVGRFE